MRINETEKKVLFEKKILEGKSSEDAYYEIERDNVYIDQSKNLVKELKREIIKLRKENEKLKDLLNKNILPPEPKIIEKFKQSKNGNVTIRDLNRILSIIQDEKSIGLTELTRLCVLKPDICKSAINFLEKNNLAKKTKGHNKMLIESV